MIENLAVVKRSEKEEKTGTNPFLKDWIGNLAVRETPEKGNQIITNPFLKGWNNCSEINNNTVLQIQSIEMQNIEPPRNIENLLAVQKSKEKTESSTNPFVKGWIDPTPVIEYVVNVTPEIQYLEQSCNNYNAMNKKMSVDGKDLSALRNSNIFKELPKEEKKFPGKIKDWFKMKWNKTFKKKNKYVSMNKFISLKYIFQENCC